MRAAAAGMSEITKLGNHSLSPNPSCHHAVGTTTYSSKRDFPAGYVATDRSKGCVTVARWERAARPVTSTLGSGHPSQGPDSAGLGVRELRNSTQQRRSRRPQRAGLVFEVVAAVEGAKKVIGGS